MAFPNSKLPAGSQPWAREVQKRVESLESNVKANNINNVARDVQLTNSLSRISTIIDSVFVPGTTSINGFNIQANTINASAISAGTFRTSDTGQRVIVSDLDNIRFYDANGLLTAQMQGTAGFYDTAFMLASATASTNTTYLARWAGSSIFVNDDVISMSGLVQTGATITDTTLTGSVSMQEGTGLSLSSEIAIAIDGPSVDINGLTINSAGTIQGFNTTSMYSSGQIDSDGNLFAASLSAKNNGGIYGGSISLSGQGSMNTLRINGGGNISGNTSSSQGPLVINDGSYYMKLDGNEISSYTGGSGASLYLNGSGSSGAVILGDGGGNTSVRNQLNAQGGVLVTGGGITAVNVWNNNIGATGNRDMYITSSGVMGYGSSSRKFKENIQLLALDVEAILNISPVSFNYKQGALSSDVPEEQQTAIQWGFIAEDLHEAGLTGIVDYDETGDVNGLRYSQFVLALQAVVRHQAEQINNLSARIEALENK